MRAGIGGGRATCSSSGPSESGSSSSSLIGICSSSMSIMMRSGLMEGSSPALAAFVRQSDIATEKTIKTVSGTGPGGKTNFSGRAAGRKSRRKEETGRERQKFIRSREGRMQVFSGERGNPGGERGGQEEKARDLQPPSYYHSRHRQYRHTVDGPFHRPSDDSITCTGTQT